MMSTLNWYFNRLKSMSVSEVLWRFSSLLRDVFDRYRIILGIFPQKKSVLSSVGPTIFQPGFDAVLSTYAEWSSHNERQPFSNWSADVVRRANLICEHKLSYFDLSEVDHGSPINWLKDHSSNKLSPLVFSQSINYRDFETVGDCKLVWEPNRHHHLVVLGRAYVATADERYAKEIVDQINSWLTQNPFGYGMNWRSPLELGVRLINWIWAIDLIRDSKAVTEDFFSSFTYHVYLHCWDNARKYSRGSSANNHLIGEAAGVYVAATYFPQFPESEKWRIEAKQILEEEIIAQSFSDGCTREHAFGYQLFVVQFFLYCGLAGKSSGDDFSDAYWQRLESLIDFLGQMAEAGPIPMIGDADDGYVLDMSGRGRDLKAIFALGAVLFDRSDFKLWSKDQTEMVFWMLGADGYEQYQNIDCADISYPLQSKQFREAGYYLLQTGNYDSPDNVSVFMDVADLGYGAIAAHGHADALSISLRVGGKNVLVDTGTYDYFTYPALRNYFRSTVAHNTICVSDMDQSENLGSFMWGERANASLLQWCSDEKESEISAEHDGYLHLPAEVMHRRDITLNAGSGRVEVVDTLSGKGDFSIKLHFHFDEKCIVTDKGDNTFGVVVDGDTHLEMSLDKLLNIELVIGKENPPGGWVSYGYHQKSAATMLVASAVVSESVVLSTTILQK